MSSNRIETLPARSADRVDRNVTAQLAIEDDDTIPMDATCPYCKHGADVGECFDGSYHRCGHCGKRVFAYAVSDADGGNPQMLLGCGETTPSSFLTGHQRTQARWRRHGRR
jgi:hypothetical protein